MKLISTKSGKPLVLIAAILTVLLVAVGGTLAWLQVNSGEKINTFQMAAIKGTVHETFDGSAKKDVYVQNDSNIDVYVRVALVPTWQDTDGNVLPETASADNLSFHLGSGWFQGSDGFYYYQSKVAPNSQTGNLADVITPTGGPSGAEMNLQVLSEVIQAEPADAVQNAWSVTAGTDGTIRK